MKRTYLRLLFTLAIALLLPSVSQATIIVNDSFADGDAAATGPLEADFYGSSTSNAIEASTGSLGLVSGSSGRQIHGLFPTQTLAAAGDSVTLTFTFETPDTVASGNEDLRFGLFDHLGRTSSSQLGQNTTYSSSNPNADYSGLPGFYVELDVESADSGTDLNIRTSDPSTTGRLLATSSGFTSLGSGPDIGYAIVANTTYTASVTVERTINDELDITASFLGNDFTVTDTAALSFDFGMIGFSSSSSAFGSSNSVGDPDNGIEIMNVTIESNIASSVVPEPTSALLILLGGFALVGKRRQG